MRGEVDGWRNEVFVQISEYLVGRAVRTPRWKYCVFAPEKDGGRDPSSRRYVERHLYRDVAEEEPEIVEAKYCP